MDSSAGNPTLSELEDSIAAAWQEAAVELGLKVTAPGTALDGSGRAVAYVVRVHSFGAEAGTVCRHLDADPEARSRLSAWASKEGLYFSLLSDSYARFERDLFVSTLNDWGWYGTGDAPDWYSGAAWGH